MEPGSQLGHYTVLSEIGRGGMGVVWKAKDNTLGREVAIKTLPPEFADDPDRLARFEREAKLLASLNHPNIAAIYGLEEHEGTRYLVLELIEGDTLADRIARGAIPVEESVKLALQIAEALEAAHETGVIHRDLKPANIKITSDDRVKVLDFGLAKAFAGNEPEPSVSNSPTLSMQATRQGVILGTAAYMSPEQTKGRAMDKRTDIWAFGCVLYEMITGTRAFQGDDASEILASIIKGSTDLTLLPDDVHPSLPAVLGRCLEKDLRKRFRDIGDVHYELTQAMADPTGARTRTAAEAAASPHSSSFAWIAAGAFLVVGVVAGWVLKPGSVSEPGEVIRFSHRLEDELFTRDGRPLIDLSPDGTQLAYVANSMIYLRRLDRDDAQPIPGTEENPSTPVFSPDGDWIAFWSSDGVLKKIPVAGGRPVELAPIEQPFGATWTADDTILFAAQDGIWSVSADGGEPVRVVEAADDEFLHGPQLLPGGDRILFTSARGTSESRWDEADIVVMSLESRERIVVHRGGGDVRYVPTGHLLYAAGNDLFAIRFDLGNLETLGSPIALVQGIRRATSPSTNTASGQYALTDDGTLAYIPGAAGQARFSIALVDRTGAAEILEAPSRDYWHPRFSPDDTRIAVGIRVGGEFDIWIYDIENQTLNPLTFEGGERPLWSPDGDEVAFLKDDQIWTVASDFTGEPRIVEGTLIEGNLGPSSWSPDGRTLLYQGTPEEVFAVQLDSSGNALEETPAGSPLLEDASQASFSNDGRWIAFVSSVRAEDTPDLSVVEYPPSARRLVSELGYVPVWSRDGEEIFFVTFSRDLASIRLRRDPTLTWNDSPEILFSTLPYWDFGQDRIANYDVSRDGERVLALIPTSDGDEGPLRQQINVVIDWFEELNAQVPIE